MKLRPHSHQGSKQVLIELSDFLYSVYEILKNGNYPDGA